MMALHYRAFRNALCLLRSLEMDEMVRAGVIETRSDYALYEDDAALFFLSIGSARAEKMWALIEAKQPEELRADEGASA